MIQRMINPFKKIKLYLINPETGELKITYLCDKCGKEMEEPDYWWFKSTIDGKDNGYHFVCKECKDSIQMLK